MSCLWTCRSQGLRKPEHIINPGQADAIPMAREFLPEAYGQLHAAEEVRQSVSWPMQYLRAAPSDAHLRVPVNLDKPKSCFEEQHAIPEGVDEILKLDHAGREFSLSPT